MPAGQWILANVPTIIIFFGMLLLATGIAVGGLLIVRRYVPPHKLKGHHDIAGPIFGTIGVIYAVLLAFTTIIVWEQYDSASQNLSKEANYYGDLYRNALAFPEPTRSEFRAALNEFVDTVIAEEWHSPTGGSSSLKVTAAAKKLNGVFVKFDPVTEKEKIIFQQVLNQLNSAGEVRRQRVLDANQGLPPILWLVLVMGGCITVTSAFFFGADNKILQVIMVVMVAMLIALELFTIFALDYPFTGDLRVHTEALEHIILVGRY